MITHKRTIKGTAKGNIKDVLSGEARRKCSAYLGLLEKETMKGTITGTAKGTIKDVLSARGAEKMFGLFQEPGPRAP